MRPRKFEGSNTVYRLPGGNEDNDLFALVEDGSVTSQWELNDAERDAIARGGRVALCVEMEPTPPVRLAVVERVEERTFQVESLEARARRTNVVLIPVDRTLIDDGLLGRWDGPWMLRVVAMPGEDLLYQLEMRKPEEGSDVRDDDAG